MQRFRGSITSLREIRGLDPISVTVPTFGPLGCRGWLGAGLSKFRGWSRAACAAVVVSVAVGLTSGLLDQVPVPAQAVVPAVARDVSQLAGLPSGAPTRRTPPTPAGSFENTPPSPSERREPRGAPSGFDVSESRVVETTAERQVFENPDGTKTMLVSSGVARVKDAQDRWVDVDLSLDRAGQRFAPRVGVVPLTLGDSTNQPLAIIDAGSGESLSFALPDARADRAAHNDAGRTSPGLVYEDVLPSGVDLDLKPTRRGREGDVFGAVDRSRGAKYSRRHRCRCAVRSEGAGRAAKARRLARLPRRRRFRVLVRVSRIWGRGSLQHPRIPRAGRGARADLHSHQEVQRRMSAEVVRLPALQRFPLVALLVGLGMYFFGSAAAELSAESARGPVTLIFGVSLLFLAFRILGVRVEVTDTHIRIEGMLRGEIVERSPGLKVAPERRLLGMDGLVLRDGAGRAWRLPLLMTSADHLATVAIHDRLQKLLEEHKRERTDRG